MSPACLHCKIWMVIAQHYADAGSRDPESGAVLGASSEIAIHVGNVFAGVLLAMPAPELRQTVVEQLTAHLLSVASHPTTHQPWQGLEIKSWQ